MKRLAVVRNIEALKTLLINTGLMVRKIRFLTANGKIIMNTLREIDNSLRSGSQVGEFLPIKKEHSVVHGHGIHLD